MKEILIGRVYRHYKGNYYRVLELAKHTESLEELVVYKALYGENNVWCRPISMWFELVNVDGKDTERFTLVEDYDG